MMKRNNRTTAMRPPEYRVIRAWPGVRNGQVLTMHPIRAQRLLKGKFIVPADSKE